MIARSVALAAALCLAPGFGLAQEPAKEDMQVVPVNGMKKPEMRNYRAAWAGFEAFDKYRALAPAAPLHFRMVSRNPSAVAPLDGVELKIVGDNESIPVPIAADGKFTLPRVQAAYDSDALLVLNRKQGLLRASPDIRTPGLPDNVRRLGDLRLECQVLVAVVKEEIPFMVNALINSLLLTRDWCSKEKLSIGFRAERTPATATLVHGERRQGVRVSGEEYVAPIGDSSWPDDAVIELTFEKPAT
jgi:hypothetical protein